MKKRILLLIALPFLVNAQSKNDKNHAASTSLKCSTCHDCSIPTKEKPCLKMCPRENMITIEQKPADAPKTIVIDIFHGKKNLYGPVTFSHQAHAEMAFMSGGCKMCHHYNPPGNVIGCSECHEKDRKRTDVSKPDLVGAEHRLCLNCHRSWSGSTDCVQCHQPKGKLPANVTNQGKQKSAPIHPTVKIPTVITYKTNTNQGKEVTFYHDQHVNFFGKDCSECHSNQSCTKCHAAPGVKKIATQSTAEKHLKCSSCHNTKTSCTTCHANKEMPGFSHVARTGFDITRFHGNLACSRCHTTKGIFTGLKADCVNCHGKWTQENFQHKVTGVVLDETHSALECTDCHQEKNYVKPDCKNCHDDKSFPANVPGKLIKKRG